MGLTGSRPKQNRSLQFHNTCSVRRDVSAALGRIGNRVRTTDGTAAVYGPKLPLAQASHWRNLRRQQAACIPQGMEAESQKTCCKVLCHVALRKIMEGDSTEIRLWYSYVYTAAFLYGFQPVMEQALLHGICRNAVINSRRSAMQFFLKSIGRKLLEYLLVLFSVSILTFALTYFAPGDPAYKMITLNGGDVGVDVIEQMREEMGLNDPFHVQYGRWLVKALHGDLGVSYTNGHPVSQEIAGKMKNTLILASVSFAVLLLIAFPLGVFSAIYNDRLPDYVIRALSFFGISMPNFWLGLLLMYLLSVKWRLLPIVGKLTVLGMIMPVTTIVVQLIGMYTQRIRAAILLELDKPYVNALRIRGISRKTIILRNVLPNSMTSVITLLGISAGALLSGTAIVEQIFSWNGIGRFALEAISYQDYPIIQAYVLQVCLIYTTINLLVDVIVFFQNPRLREGALA